MNIEVYRQKAARKGSAPAPRVLLCDDLAAQQAGQRPGKVPLRPLCPHVLRITWSEHSKMGIIGKLVERA
jgi:hypothetical protein